MKITVDPKLTAEQPGEYVLKKNGTREEPFDPASIQNGVVVRVSPDVLRSDEAIVGVIRHEMYEIENLARMVEDGYLTNADVTDHVRARNGQNLHGQAWDVADLEVLAMREKPGTPHHDQLIARQKMLLERFDAKNHGSQ